MIPEPKDPALAAWTAINKRGPVVDPFAAFMRGYKEGFAAGCENCIGIEPPAPRVPTIDELRAAMTRPWAPRRLCELLRGRR